MATTDKISSAREGENLTVGRTKGGKIAVSWECESEASGYRFPMQQRVLMTREEAEFLRDELCRILQ